MARIGIKTGNKSKDRPKHSSETGGKTKTVVSESKAESRG